MVGLGLGLVVILGTWWWDLVVGLDVGLDGGTWRWDLGLDVGLGIIVPKTRCFPGVMKFN